MTTTMMMMMIMKIMLARHELLCSLDVSTPPADIKRSGHVRRTLQVYRGIQLRVFLYGAFELVMMMTTITT